MLTGIVIGAGDRGYDSYAKALLDQPGLGRVVAVADPDEGRRRRFAERYGLDDDACFPGWDEICAEPRLADWALVATGDRHHVEPTLAALAAGYHVLLEKPMALDEAACVRLVEAAESADRILGVCHVYRFSHLFDRLHRVVASGALGQVLSIQQSENVAWWHYAHSYVRGHTRRSDVPWLLQKSCHDLDVITWLAGSTAVEVSSFARSTELTDANAPEGAPEHCIEGCPHQPDCPYDAVALYRDLRPLLGDLTHTARPRGLSTVAKVARRALPLAREAPVASIRSAAEWWRWPVSAVTDDHTPEGLDTALRTTRWGRCAWKVGDNDQPSAQSVQIRYANDVVASFLLQSSSHRSMRYVRVDGTEGSAFGHLYALDGELTVVDHRGGPTHHEHLPATFDGHGGGERPLFLDFLAAVRDGREPRTSARASLESHRIAFAALRSAEIGETVRLR